MRKFVLLLMLSISYGLFANPILPRVVQQIWFTDAGELIVQFGPEAHYIQGADVIITDGMHSTGYILDFSGVPESTPMDVNLTELMPDLDASPEAGFLRFTYDAGTWFEQLRWNPNGSGDAYSIIATQSIYQTTVSDPLNWFDINLWAKSDHPDYVQNYTSSSMSTIQLHVRDEEDEPVADVPVYYLDFDSNPWAYSDEDGFVSLELPCARTRLRVFHPESEDPIFDENFIAEPAGCYVFNVDYYPSSNQDQAQELAPEMLTLYPQVLRAGQKLNLKLEGGSQGSDTIRLYDIKGRFLGEHAYSAEWNPPKLSSGIYFLQVNRMGKALARERFIILH